MPSKLLSVIKDMYHEDKYVLIDGDKQASVQPTYGVKQGCPLSPLLFSIYLNDIGYISEGVTGAVTGTPGFQVSDMLYADDLALTANNPNHMQQMLDKLQGYARKKCLTVNTKKTEVVCFNSRSTNLHSLMYDGDRLPYSESFKYLGMVCDKRLNLSTAAEAALKPCIAGTYRIKTFAKDHNLTHRLHAFIWLLKTYVIPAGLYACQIWATPYLRQGTEMDNPLQKWILNVLRTQLGVRSTTPSWNILRECGIEPFQFNWFRATMRFYNSLTQCNSQLLKGVLHADI